MSAGVSLLPMHDGPAPHSVPAGLSFALSTQVIAPVVHEVTPTLQRLGLVLHEAPAVQAPQTPEPLQTLFVPQLLPAVLLLAVSMQVVAPVEQDVVPSLHGLGLPEQALPAVHAPQTPEPLQTMFVPQLVPAPLLPPSMHVIAPVVQDVVPFLQAVGLVVQPVPAVQAPQTPEPLQTMFVPQLVPAALLPPSMHVIAPVVQDVVPFLQAAPGFVVQLVAGRARAARARAVADHVRPAAGAGRLVAPVDARHRARRAGRRAVPASCVRVRRARAPGRARAADARAVADHVRAAAGAGRLVGSVDAGHQAGRARRRAVLADAWGWWCTRCRPCTPPQTPTLQTRFVPHVVPFATFPVSAQTGTPVTHEVAPILQWFVGWQAAALVHAPHVPLLQTMFVPQDAPLARFRPVSEHVIVGAQVCVPAWHGFAGAQASPAVHDAQAPELHTMFVPHDVPLATFPVSVQTGAPEVHTVAAVRQGLPVTTQLAPAVQAVHVPVALQTLLVPHAVPAARLVFLSVQTGDPVAQASVPAWQGFVGAQAAPS